MQHLLFLCSGNYYRSRFAEEYFNGKATEKNILWQAESKGLKRDLSETATGNIGPIAWQTIKFLIADEISAQHAGRYPQAVQTADFEAYHHIIAVCEREHRPMIDSWFPHHSDKVTYWQIDDIDVAEPETAIALLKVELDKLLIEMSQIEQADEFY